MFKRLLIVLLIAVSTSSFATAEESKIQLMF